MRTWQAAGASEQRIFSHWPFSGSTVWFHGGCNSRTNNSCYKMSGLFGFIANCLVSVNCINLHTHFLVEPRQLLFVHCASGQGLVLTAKGRHPYSSSVAWLPGSWMLGCSRLCYSCHICVVFAVERQGHGLGPNLCDLAFCLGLLPLGWRNCRKGGTLKMRKNTLSLVSYVPQTMVLGSNRHRRRETSTIATGFLFFVHQGHWLQGRFESP